MQDQDRRQFFRIDQHISLELKVISESEISDHPKPSQFGVSPNFLLLSELQQMDSASAQLMRKVTEKDPTLASVLNIMNDRHNQTIIGSGSSHAKINVLVHND